MTTVKDIIDDFILEKDDHNSIFRHARRTHIKSLAKRGLKKLEYTLRGNVRAVSFAVPPSQSVDVPDDYEEWVRVSVQEDCKLHPVRYNDELPAYVSTYLQDCSGEFLYDCCNDIVKIDTSTSCRHSDCAKECNECMRMIVCDPCEEDYWFKEGDDKFIFSPNLEGKEIFIEYISTGWTTDMDECEIKIKDTYHEPLLAWMRWQYLRGINHHMGVVEEHRRYWKNLNTELKTNTLQIDNREMIKILDARFRT